VLAVYAADDAYQVFTQDTLQVEAPGVLANDSNQAGGTLSAVLVGNVAHGTLTFRSNGSFDYQPAANFVGLDSFTYRATANDIPSNLATVTIEVYSRNMYLPFVRR
jgi:large repetitive protein